MTIIQVYEKYKHLDQLLSDPRWIDGAELKYQMLFDCWSAIKEYCKPEEHRPESVNSTIYLDKYGPFMDQTYPPVPVLAFLAEEDFLNEVDMAAIFKTEKGFLGVVISGCSCWPTRGYTEWSSEVARIEALYDFFINAQGWGGNALGIKKLIEKAHINLNQING